MTKENAEDTWPEQQAIYAWCSEHGIDVSADNKDYLARKVSQYRQTLEMQLEWVVEHNVTKLSDMREAIVGSPAPPIWVDRVRASHGLPPLERSRNYTIDLRFTMPEMRWLYEVLTEMAPTDPNRMHTGEFMYMAMLARFAGGKPQEGKEDSRGSMLGIDLEPEQPDGWTASWCPEHGLDVLVDSEGLCNSCGATAVGEGAERAAKLEKLLSAASEWADKRGGRNALARGGAHWDWKLAETALLREIDRVTEIDTQGADDE